MSKFARTMLLIPALLWVIFLSACGQKSTDQSGPAAQREYAQGDTIDVAGLLVDTRCFAANRANIGRDHPHPVPTSQSGPACARYCARQGFPVGVATDGAEGPVWILLATPPVLSDYMAETVRIRGVVRSDGILMPERIEAKTADGGWTYVM